MCSLHVSDLCMCIRDVISEFKSWIQGSLAFCALMLFLCSILCLMCSGSSLHMLMFVQLHLIGSQTITG